MKGLGDLLRRFRKEHGMSQDALAVSLGMTQQAVSAIERGGGVSEENWPEIEKILKRSGARRKAGLRCGRFQYQNHSWST